MDATNSSLFKPDAKNLPLGERSKLAVLAYRQSFSALDALAEFVFPNTTYFGGGSQGFGWMSLTGGDTAAETSPYRNVNAYNSSVVMAFINWIVKAFREAEEQTYRKMEDGSHKVLPTHRFTRFIRSPNPYYNFNKMLSVTLISYFLDGNGYWFKERGEGGLGQTRGLYYIPHYQIEPKQEPGSNDYVSYYEYTVNGITYRIAPNRIVHFRYELDPYNPIKGRKMLNSVLSEIYTDEEAAAFTAALIKNTGIPGVTIAPDTEKVKVDEADALAIKEAFKRNFGGEKRGEPMVMNFAGKVTQMGFNPEQLQFKDIRRLPEERVAAQFGLSPMVVNLGAGLDRSTYSNYEEALKAAYYSCIIPLWLEIGEEIEAQLLPEFTGADDSYGFRFDYGAVRGLQESAEKKQARITRLWTADGILRAELREGCGYAVDEKRDNVFFSDVRVKTGLLNPNPVAPPPDPAKSLFNRIKGLLKAGSPEDELDAGLELQLEASVKGATAEMESDLISLYRKMEEEGGKASAQTVDMHNPEAEAERILSEIVNSIGLTLIIKGIWGSMGKAIEAEVIQSVILRLAIVESKVWDEEVSNTVKSLLLLQANAYQTALIEQTRKAIEEAIKGAESGESVVSIARRIKANIAGREMYPGIFAEAYQAAKDAGATEEQALRAGESKARRYRAKLIAETETRTFQNNATLEGFEKAGLQKVKVTDGDGCGWRKHNDTDKAHNTTRELKDAKKYPLAHPNCKRRFYPVKA